MKILIALTFLSFSLMAYAESTITFQCKSEKVPGINEFSAKGIIALDSMANIEGVISVIVKKMNEDESAQIFEQISIQGTLKHFNAGEVTSYAFDQLILTSSNPYLKSMNLLLDEKAALSSAILSIDNFLYRSNCERIK